MIFKDYEENLCEINVSFLGLTVMVSQTIFILLYRNNCPNLAKHLSKYVALLH